MIPPPPAGQELHTDLISVQLTDAGGTNTILRHVVIGTACGAQGSGWYFDDPISPRTIVACPATCDVIMATQPEVTLNVRCRAF